MQATGAEIEAAKALAVAAVNFLVALEEGRRSRTPAVRTPTAFAPTSPVASNTPYWPEKEQPQKPTEMLVSAQAAAKLLALSPRTLWSMTSPRGPIPAIRLGSLVRYSIDELQRWVKKNIK